MALNKKSEFDEDIQRLAEFAKAISHPARIAILQTIAQKSECICGEIVEVIPLSQSTVSQHLKELKEIGLIQGEIEGAKSCYCINWDQFNQFQDHFTLIFKEIKRNKKTNKQKC